MAEQLNILNSGQVIATALHTEVQRSYLEYAMSVIVGRALPDVRDGLKPVHRRILYAMHELGLTPDRPYRKCARVVGDVLGKYHPHGDQAVYDALVRMVQTFSSRYPLLEGHGNFGSVDDDPPAAMRYTETRLAAVGNEGLLSEIGEATVDFIGNFDNSQQEPIVLPAQLPFLLLNGCSGIAVGMATNVPPHNLGELVDGLIALIDRPELSDDELFRLIPAPDFPTGGEILDTSGIREAYRTGRGSIPIRGVAKLEEIVLGRGRHRRLAIVVTELPFQVNKAGWIEKVAELVNQGKIDGIADIRDESDRDGMRVVIEMRREGQPAQILDKLYRLTPLQINFGVIMLAIANSQPRQMSLRELLQHFLNFREETLTRQYRYEQEKAEARAHLLEGMLTALGNLDGVIEILRRSPDGSTAKIQMQERFGFSERQSSAILAMPLSRLTGMERQKIQDEYHQLNDRMDELDRLLNNRKELLKSLKKDLRTLKRKFADDRRTRIITAAELASAQAELAQFGGDEETAEQEVVLEFTQKGYVRRFTPKAYQKRQEKQETSLSQTLTEAEDFPVQTETANTGHALLMLTRDGKAYSASIASIQTTSRQSKGTPLVTLLPPTAQSDPEAIVSPFILPSAPEDLEGLDLVLLTKEGRLKRMALAEFANLTARGITALKLKESDELRFVRLTQAGEQLILATSTGRLLRLEVNDEQIPLMGRSAQGQQAMRLHKNEQLVDCVTALKEDDLLLMTAQGDAKRIPVSTLKLMSRGGLGVQAIQFSTRTDTLAAAVLALPNAEVTVLTSTDRLAKLPIDKVPLLKRPDAGDRVLKLSKSEKVVRLFEHEAIGEEEALTDESA